MVQQNSIKHLISFVHKLEEKLLSVKTIHETLHELMLIVSKTHETILEELTNIKTVLHEHEDDEIIPIDATKSEWNDEENENVCQRNSPSSTLENHSKKSDRSLSRSKSPQAVSFPTNENEITTPILPSLSKQNQLEIIPKIWTDIRIHEIEPKNGDYLRLVNLSNSDDYDLSEHFLQQNINSKLFCRFRFPSNTILQAGHTITVWCGYLKDIIPQPPYVFVWKEQKKWETKPECITILAKPNGQSIAWFRTSHYVNSDESSSDILFVHSKSNAGSSDTSATESSLINPSTSRAKTRQSRRSAFSLTRNNKPPFAHSPTNPIHPDHNGTNPTIPNDFRSQMHQRSGISPLLNRPKSSPFASHVGCKQDLISMNFLRTQQTQGQKQTTIKT